jgi:hypothetical protein
MGKFSRSNATGRSTGRLLPKERKLVAPPNKQSWAWLTRDLLNSDAWSGMSLHCRRFVDFLILDHCSHGGRENGNLQATYDQLVRYGIPRKRIANAIREAVARGLVEVMRKGGLFGMEARRTTSLYRLTWYGTISPARYPTNEWSSFKEGKFSVSRVGTVGSKSSGKKVA